MPDEEVLDGGQGPGEDTDDGGEPEVKEPEGPTIEDLAREQGWKPQDDFSGHEEDYVDAVEYIRNGKPIQDGMRKHLKENRKSIDRLEDQVSTGLQNIQAHNDQLQKAQESRHRTEIAKLRKDRDTAIEEGDVGRVHELEDELGEKYSNAPEPKKPSVNKPDPVEIEEFEGWKAENDWYKEGSDGRPMNEATQYAKVQSDNPDYAGLSYEQRRNKVTKKVKEMFPEKFESTTPKTPRAQTVEGGRPPATGKKSKSFSARDLSDEERSVMNSFVRMKAFDSADKKLTDPQAKQRYMKELAETKEELQ